MKRRTIVYRLIGGLLAVSPAFALPQDEAQKTQKDEPPHKAGYRQKPVFGGPNSPGGQLEENDRDRDPAFRFPAIDAVFDDWNSWKRRLNEEHGLKFTGHYATLGQRSTSATGGTMKASSAILRGTFSWTLLGRGEVDTGALVVMLDHRHAFRGITPADLGGQAGYIGQTGTLFTDAGFVVPNLNWQQSWNGRSTGLLVGRYDPSDYMTVLGSSNPWTMFSNLAILLEPSVAFPDSSWGVGGGHWLTDQWYVQGGANDANGKLTDDFEFFADGAELFTWANAGWSPSKDERYTKNVHITGWHVDDRDTAGIQSASGVGVAANWTFNKEWMPFARAGWSTGSAPLYNASATAGIVRQLPYRSDLVGGAINRGVPPNSTLRDQTTIESFWRFQFSENFAITPNIQLLIDPALNTTDDVVWVFGLRMRLTF
jgi:porin